MKIKKLKSKIYTFKNIFDKWGFYNTQTNKMGEMLIKLENIEYNLKLFFIIFFKFIKRNVSILTSDFNLFLKFYNVYTLKYFNFSDYSNRANIIKFLKNSSIILFFKSLNSYLLNKIPNIIFSSDLKTLFNKKLFFSFNYFLFIFSTLSYKLYIELILYCIKKVS